MQRSSEKTPRGFQEKTQKKHKRGYTEAIVNKAKIKYLNKIFNNTKVTIKKADGTDTILGEEMFKKLANKYYKYVGDVGMLPSF